MIATNTTIAKPAVTDSEEVGALKPGIIPAPGRMPMKLQTMMKMNMVAKKGKNRAVFSLPISPDIKLSRALMAISSRFCNPFGRCSRCRVAKNDTAASTTRTPHMVVTSAVTFRPKIRNRTSFDSKQIPPFL